VLLPAISCSVQAGRSGRAEREAGIEASVNKAVESGKLKLTVHRIIPAYYPAKTSVDGYFLSISRDTLNCYLPYIGEMRRAVYYPVNLGFEIENQKIEYQKTVIKGGYRFTFDVKSDKTHETYSITLELYLSGFASISVFTNYRDNISYYCNIVLDEKNE